MLSVLGLSINTIYGFRQQWGKKPCRAFQSGSLFSVSLQLALSLAAFGQGGATGAITGTVQDPSGAVVGNADVRITNQDTNVLERSVKTGADGAFTAPLLPVGTYRVSIQAAGFTEGKFADIVVRVTETTRMIAKLTTQSVQQTIEVQAEVQTVNTTDATTGQAIDSNTIRALPLATQNFQQLLTLSTGAASELNAAAQLGRGNVRIVVNGQREDNNNYLLEGISVTDYNVAELTNTPLPNPDVVNEFKVQTSLYDASQGRNGGGNINAILKSGTNTLHGDAYEFFRNTVLDANEYFLKGSGAPRPVIQQNIFGGSLGGPVSPGGKLGFFFVNYQGTRQRSGDSPGTLISTFIPYVPLADRGAAGAAQLAADFGVPSTDPVAESLLAFQSNQFGAPANGYLYPLPTEPAGTAAGSYVQFTVSKPGKFTDDQFTANWDHEFRQSKDSVAARFFYSDSEQDIPFGAGGLQASLGGAASGTDLNFPYQLPIHDRVFVLSETHVFSPTLVNDFRFGLVHINNSAVNVNPVTAADAGIDRPTSNLTSSIYKFTFATSGFQFGPTPQANQAQTQNNLNFVENLSWVKGAHTLTFGGQYIRVRLDKLFPQVFNGQLFFTNTSPTVTDFANFIGGTPEFSFGGGGVYNHAYRQSNSAVFAQDDWKATSNLTVNLGLRTEFLGAWTDGECHIGNMESDLTKSGTYPFVYPTCVNKLGVSGLTGNAAGSTFKNSVSTGWGPRVGFAWDVLGRHKTTLRGGYGIYYVREDVGAVDQLSFQSPFIPIVFFGQTPGFTMSNFFTGNPGRESECGAGCGIAERGMASLPGAADKLPGYERRGDVRRMHRAGRQQHAESVCAGGAPALRGSEYPAMEPDHAAGTGQELGARSWIRWNSRHPPARNARRDPVGERDPGKSVHGEGQRGELLHDHDRYVCQCDRAHANPRVERIFRISDFCQRCLLDLSRAAGDRIAAMEPELFPGGVHVLEEH